MEIKEKTSFSWWYVVIFIIILGALTQKKSYKSYNSEVYSSWEEEQLDECRADINYLLDKLDHK